MTASIALYPLDKCTDDKFIGIEVTWDFRKETLCYGPMNLNNYLSMQNAIALRDQLNELLEPKDGSINY